MGIVLDDGQPTRFQPVFRDMSVLPGREPEGARNAPSLIKTQKPIVWSSLVRLPLTFDVPYTRYCEGLAGSWAATRSNLPEIDVRNWLTVIFPVRTLRDTRFHPGTRFVSGRTVVSDFGMTRMMPHSPASRNGLRRSPYR